MLVTPSAPYHGANGDRGALKALLDAAKAGRFKPGTRLIVDSLDRLTRQEISAAVRLFLDIVDTGLIIVTLIDGEQVFTKERVDNDLTALVIAIVILSRANNESKTKSERVRKARQIAIKKAREHKIPMGGPHPKWLKLVGEGDSRRFVVIEHHARVIEQIWELAASGLGQVKIVQQLNREGAPTLNGSPRWGCGMIGHLLVNKAVVGTFLPRRYVVQNGKPIRLPDLGGAIEGYFPAIISNALYDRAKLACKDRNVRGENRRGRAYLNLVRGIGRCGVCGDALDYSQSTRGFAYLRCVSSRGQRCSNRSGFPYRKLEALLLAFDQLLYATTTLISGQLHSNASAHHLAQLKGSIDRKKAKLRKLVAAFADKSGPVREAAMAEIDTLGAEIRRGESEVVDAHHERGLISPNGFLARFMAGRIKMESGDGPCCRRGRAR